eukprot:gene14502-19469_t
MAPSLRKIIKNEDKIKTDIDNKNVKTSKSKKPKLWDSLAWKSVDVNKENLGSFEDSMFFGLEEVDGNDYIYKKNENSIIVLNASENKRKRDIDVIDAVINTNENSVENSNKEEAVMKKKKAKKMKKLKKSKNKLIISDNSMGSLSSYDAVEIDTSISDWAGVELQSILYDSLVKLNFLHPTPIQMASIPIAISSNADIVGAAETGSGKTLAFVLPILNSILINWSICCNLHSPYALIIAPTRELAMQISTVLRDVCKVFSSTCKVEIVTIVGGMSEHKQRRQLCGLGKPTHVVVATVGRLSQIIEEEDVVAFQDMSTLRFLVVDEADRIMEDGHFPELHRILSRIRDHENLRKQGKDPIQVAKLAREGTGFQDVDEVNENDSNNRIEVLDENGMTCEEEIIDFEPFPSDADMQHASDTQSSISRELLKKSKKWKLAGTLLGISSDSCLPLHIKQLLSTVAIQSTINVIDVTGSNITNSKLAKINSVKDKTNNNSNLSAVGVSLPAGLTQLELRVPTEDKDLYTYYYLLKNSGRTLLFVNSIKTARRVDGLLRALGLNSRAIHAQLQQKQRLKAIESFQMSPIGILVATDVAARGLDIPMIQYVIHYDVARSPQVYIHRSGRTARANTTGITVSVVSPEDAPHHAAVCSHIGVLTFPTVVVDDLGLFASLKERVKLAKK